jgi:hypothetical protein
LAKIVAQGLLKIIDENPHHDFQCLILLIKLYFRNGDMDRMKKKQQAHDMDNGAYIENYHSFFRLWDHCKIPTNMIGQY